jgi:hypothetical protein
VLAEMSVEPGEKRGQQTRFIAAIGRFDDRPNRLRWTKP